MDAATSFPPVPQILARHRQPVAAVIDARMISDLPGDGEAERIDVQRLLEEGGSVTLTFDPGENGRCDEGGYVVTEPRDPAFEATARSWDGTTIGSGAGGTIAEAMIRVYRCPAPVPGPAGTGPYSDEPPF